MPTTSETERRARDRTEPVSRADDTGPGPSTATNAIENDVSFYLLKFTFESTPERSTVVFDIERKSIEPARRIELVV